MCGNEALLYANDEVWLFVMTRKCVPLVILLTNTVRTNTLVAIRRFDCLVWYTVQSCIQLTADVVHTTYFLCLYSHVWLSWVEDISLSLLVVFVVVYNATGPKIFSLKFLCFNFSMLLSFCCWSFEDNYWNYEISLFVNDFTTFFLLVFKIFKV